MVNESFGVIASSCHSSRAAPAAVLPRGKARPCSGCKIQMKGAGC